MEIATKKTSRFLLVVGLIAFVAVAFFGISLTMGMEMRDNGSMGGCIFDGRAEMCAMNFAEHISQWQSMFTFTPPQKALAFALLLLLAVVFVAVAILKRNLLLLFSYYTTRWRLYIRHNPELSLFDPLKEAFSRGILNPKIY